MATDREPVEGAGPGEVHRAPHPEHAEHVRREHLHERFEHLEDAAIAAEMESGHREETVEEAKRGLVKRAVRIGAGLAVTAFGVLLLVLPGPGLIVVAAGLVILAQDVPFAARLLEKVRKRLPADADGNVPKGMVVGGLCVSALAVAGSVWWTFLR